MSEDVILDSDCVISCTVSVVVSGTSILQGGGRQWKMPMAGPLTRSPEQQHESDLLVDIIS